MKKIMGLWVVVLAVSSLAQSASAGVSPGCERKLMMDAEKKIFQEYPDADFEYKEMIVTKMPTDHWIKVSVEHRDDGYSAHYRVQNDYDCTGVQFLQVKHYSPSTVNYITGGY